MKLYKLITGAALLSAFFFTGNVSFAQAQKPAATAPAGDFHSHSGFHFEAALGPAFGTITDRAPINGSVYDFVFLGTGIDFEMKLGGAVQENFILSFDILSKAISSPEVSLGGQTAPTSNNLSLGEVTYGLGFTDYLMPTDIILSGTIGMGTFVIHDGSANSNSTTRSRYGLSGEVRLGKHWWISSKWGISLFGGYGFTGASTNYGEQLTSSRWVIAASIGLH